MSKELFEVSAEKISEMTGYKPAEIAVVKNTVAKNTTDTELAYFLNVCKSVELNPFNKEIWCYKDKKGNLLVFAGRDGFLSKAQRNPAFNGIRSCEVCESDEFSIDIANNIIKHNFGTDERGRIRGAYAIVFRKAGEPTIEYADIQTYDKKQFTWNSHKASMIKKVAETNALKKAFGISGIQSEYDFEVKNDVVIANQPEGKSDINIAKEKIIEALETYKGEDAENIREECEAKGHFNEFDMKFAESIAKKLGIKL